MVLSHEYREPSSFEVRTPVATPVTLKPGEQVLLDTTRDNAGGPNYADLAEKAVLAAKEAADLARLNPGFVAYRKAGGRFSEGIHKLLITQVENLQKPGGRENIRFHDPTRWQVEGIVYRHNNPLGSQGPLPLEQQIVLTQEQEDAYCLLAEGYINLSGESTLDPNNPAQLGWQATIAEIQKIPLLKPQEEQPQVIAAAA